MVTYEEALLQATQLKPDINIGVEYEQGYMFGKNTDEITYGGGNAPVVILKEDGRAVSMAYFASAFEGEPVREYKI